MPRIDKIQTRRDTAANWASVNPVLAQGEAGLELDTIKLKYGNGVTAWNSLPYFAPGMSDLTTADIEDLDADLAALAADIDASLTPAEADGLYAAITHSHMGVYAQLPHSHAGEDITTGTVAAARLAPIAISGVTGLQVALDTIQVGAGYNVQSYGLVGDGVTDDTVALQALINLVAAAGGGRIYFPPGEYLIAGAFDATWGSQIKLPAVDESDPFVVIEMVGALPFTNSFWTVSTNPPSGNAYSILKSTATGGSGVNAMLRGRMVGGLFYSNLVMRYQNMGFALPANPTFTAIDMTQDLGGWLQDCLIWAGSIDLDALTQPTHTNSYALKTPGTSHSSGTAINGLGVTGFYNGILDGEATQFTNIAIQGCVQGLIEPRTAYPGQHGFVGIYYCPYSIVSDGSGDRTFTIQQLDLENPHSPQAAWQVFVNHVEDPSNQLHGHIEWFGELLAHTFVKNGGTNLTVHETGTPVTGSDVLPALDSAEIGNIADTTVVVTFTQPVKAPSYSTGVVIKVNGTPATISSSTRQSDKAVVRYVLSASVIVTDSLTFNYTAIDGFIQNEAGLQLDDLTNGSVTNNVGGGAFSPADITGMLLWLAADDLAQADGSVVSLWPDASTVTNDAVQATNGFRPLFKTSQINSLPVVRFDGTDDYLELAGAVNSSVFTYFAVVKHNSAADGVFLGHNVSGISWDIEASTQLPRLIKTFIALIGSASTGIGAGFAIIAVTYSSPNAAFYRNGSADGTASSAQSFTLTRGGIGCQFGGGGESSTFFNGDVAEIVCFDSVLGSTNRGLMFTYLNDKYAVY